jgi:hypothetical protein
MIMMNMNGQRQLPLLALVCLLLAACCCLVGGTAMTTARRSLRGGISVLPNGSPRLARFLFQDSNVVVQHRQVQEGDDEGDEEDDDDDDEDGSDSGGDDSSDSEYGSSDDTDNDTGAEVKDRDKDDKLGDDEDNSSNPDDAIEPVSYEDDYDTATAADGKGEAGIEGVLDPYEEAGDADAGNDAESSDESGDDDDDGDDDSTDGGDQDDDVDTSSKDVALSGEDGSSSTTPNPNLYVQDQAENEKSETTAGTFHSGKMMYSFGFLSCLVALLAVNAKYRAKKPTKDEKRKHVTYERIPGVW